VKRRGPIGIPRKSLNISRPGSTRCPTPIQAIGWKAQGRLCKRFRRLTARGKHPNVAVTASAREVIAFMWAIAQEVPVTA